MLEHPNIVKMHWSFDVSILYLIHTVGQTESILCTGSGIKWRSLSGSS